MIIALHNTLYCIIGAVDYETVSFYTINVKVMDTPGLYMVLVTL